METAGLVDTVNIWNIKLRMQKPAITNNLQYIACLLYTSDAADE